MDGMGKGFDKKARLCYSKRVHGEMPEWSKGAVLKTVDARASVGSNPTLSAMSRRGRVVACGGSFVIL